MRGYGSRSLEGAVIGTRPWGYMHAGAMEVEALRRLSWGDAAMGRYAGGGEEEAEGRRKEEEGGIFI